MMTDAKEENVLLRENIKESDNHISNSTTIASNENDQIEQEENEIGSKTLLY